MPDPAPTQPVTRLMPAARDHSRVFGEYLYVYPVLSRRSRGLSIGVNLNPDKVCNFNCVYCEVDRITPPRARVVDLARLRDELRAMTTHVLTGGLAAEPRFQAAGPLARQIKDFAFSGDGEPTLFAQFAACVEIVAEIRREFALDSSRILLITDAAGLDKADVQRGLQCMDANGGEIWGKLDAGTEAYYSLVNRSHVRFERILKNLLETARQRPIVIQSLFLKVRGQAMPEPELAAYCERLNQIRREGGRIREVHAYTLARPAPEPWVERLTGPELEAMAAVIRGATSLPVETFE